MKFTHPEIETVIDTENGFYNTLVIEEQRFLVRLLEDITGQIQGLDGNAVISDRDTPVTFSKYSDLLDCFVPFELNRKPLLNLITADLGKRASSPDNFERTATALAAVELWLSDLTFDYPCDIGFSNISIPALLKASTPVIRGESLSVAEGVLDYMELIEEFDRRKLFFTLNMRCFVTDEEMELFAKTAVSHGYQVIGIEGFVHPKLSIENRIVIDSDLCEIG